MSSTPPVRLALSILGRGGRKAVHRPSLWMCLLRLLKQQQSELLAQRLVHFSLLFYLCSPPLCLSLLQLSYYILLLSVQLQKRKTPNQLAREFVSQSAGQRALPIIIFFLSCSLSIAQVPQCTCKPIDMFRDLHWLQQLLV